MNSMSIYSRSRSLRKLAHVYVYCVCVLMLLLLRVWISSLLPYLSCVHLCGRQFDYYVGRRGKSSSSSNLLSAVAFTRLRSCIWPHHLFLPHRSRVTYNACRVTARFEKTGSRNWSQKYWGIWTHTSVEMPVRGTMQCRGIWTHTLVEIPVRGTMHCAAQQWCRVELKAVWLLPLMLSACDEVCHYYSRT